MEVFKKFLPKKYRWMVNILKDVEKEDRKNVISGWKNRKRYYTMENVEANLKDLARCANCPNMCRFDCPALQVSKKEPYAPAHKARVSYFVGMNHLPWDVSSSVIDTMYACMGCDACYQWCPMDISTGDLLFEMRAELEKRDLIPDRLQKLKTRIQTNGSVFEHTPFHEDLDYNHNDPDPEVFYYIGCMDLKYQPNTIKATMALLEHLEIPYCTHLESRECCGGPVRKAGFKDVAATLSKKNQELLHKSKVKTIISNCPGCIDTLKNTYSEIFGNKLKPDVRHVIDFFSEKIQNGEISLSHPIERVITYHDPCILSRRDNNIRLVDEARNILKQIPDLNLKEAYLHGDETRCCGMGGSYAVANPDYSQNLREDRLKQLKKHSPEVIVSACPTCEYAFKKAQESLHDFEQTIQDIVQLIAQAAGLEYH